MTEQKILDRLRTLGIPELLEVKSLDRLNGDYINLLCELPNGQIGKILQDDRVYFAAQIEKLSDDRCYGIASDGVQRFHWKFRQSLRFGRSAFSASSFPLSQRSKRFVLE